MDNMALKVTAAYLQSKNFHYDIIGENQNVLRTNFSMDNKDGMTVLIIFDEDNTTVSLKSYDFVKFPEAKKNDIVWVCNTLNHDYRWITFFVDESDNTVTLQDDAVIQLDSCGEEIFELLYRMVNIGDEAYPKFMAKIWG